MDDEPFRLARAPLSAARIDVLPAAEQDLARRIPSPDRRRAFVAGRIAARLALEALSGPLPDGAAILRAPDEAPRLHGVPDPPRLSITHGAVAAVAAASRARLLGVDLCDHRDAPRVHRVSERFIAAEERALAGSGDPRRWAALWALKEAAAKALRVGLLEGGLRASRLASLDPPRFARPALEALLLPDDDDATIAVVWAP